MSGSSGPYEIFFDIHGSDEEVMAVAKKILEFMRHLELSGDIVGLDCESLEETGILDEHAKP